MSDFRHYAKLLLRPAVALGMLAGVIATQEADAQERRLTGDELTSSLMSGGKVRAAYDRTGFFRGYEVEPASNAPRTDRVPSTHLRVMIPSGGIGSIHPPSREEVDANRAAAQASPGAPGSFPVLIGNYNSPASVACVYGLVPVEPGDVPGCTGAFSKANPTGGSGAIAVVVSFDTPSVTQDIHTFCKQFGLPDTNVQVIYADGVKPPDSMTGDPSGGWAIESSVDTQWAHAMAPGATIVMVEYDPFYTEPDGQDPLLHAIDVATLTVKRYGGGQVSMSFNSNFWNSATTPSEADVTAAHFASQRGVVYIGAIGDQLSVPDFPGRSTNVIAAGGTTIQRDENGNFTSDVVWNDGYAIPGLGVSTTGTGGGPNYYELRPAYQDVVQSITGPYRGTPDLSFVAEPTQWVVLRGNWIPIGGTSLSAPALAGVINVANSTHEFAPAELSRIRPPFREEFQPASTADVLHSIYLKYSSTNFYQSGFRDVTQGNCLLPEFGLPSPPQPFDNLFALPGYDLCTGLGVPDGYEGLRVPGRESVGNPRPVPAPQGAAIR